MPRSIFCLSDALRTACLTLFAALLLGTGPAFAQNQGESLYGLTESGAANPLTLLRQRLASSVTSGITAPMEGAVDPTDYYIGPGDLFTVSVAGQDITPTPIRVGADGRLALPGAGTVDIGGLSLEQAREDLLAALYSAYSNTPVDISLAQARQFYVHVSGAVPTPSRYLAMPVSRVSSVLELAFADTMRAPVQNRDFRPALRNVRLIHRDGTESRVDLLRYFSGGDTDANPYLRDGDVVYVPAFDPRFSSVYVGGAVPFPGAYDFRPGDTMLDLIEVAGGVPDNVAVTTVRLLRGSEPQTFALSDVLRGDAGNTPLEIRDQVSVQPPDRVLGSAEADGMIQHPGAYPIEDGVTTVSDLIEAAGGLRPDALLRGGYVERRSLPEPDIRPRAGQLGADMGSLSRIMAADTTEILQRIRMTDMDFLSRAYFAQETRLQNRVSVDLEAVVAGTAEPTRLRSGDRLVIPRDVESVYVIGQVNQPGFVDLVEGESAEFYIRAAGGRGEFADRAFIMHPATGSFAETGSRPIRSGDIIFVDRSVDVADSAELQRLVLEESRVRKDARIRTTQAVAQAISSIATVIALIVTLRNN